MVPLSRLKGGGPFLGATKPTKTTLVRKGVVGIQALASLASLSKRGNAYPAVAIPLGVKPERLRPSPSGVGFGQLS